MALNPNKLGYYGDEQRLGFIRNAMTEHLDDEKWESRMDIIGQNGNDGEHYDAVSHPSHYCMGEIECIDAIKAALTDDEWRGYIKGNVLKYTWRERTKGGDESLAKAVWYLNRLLDKTR